MGSDGLQAGSTRSTGATLASGHLWLLHELDDKAVNGKLFMHPAADRDLQASIISQARHAAKGRTPGLSWYVLNAANERPDLISVVLTHGIDPQLIAGALAHQGTHADPVDVANVVLRSLDTSAARAVSILDAVQQHIAQLLPPSLLAAVEDAVRDASGEAVDRPSLRRSLTALAAAPRTPVSVPPSEDTGAQDAALVARLERAQRGYEADRLLARWTRPLPWQVLVASVDAGRVGSDVIERLTDREDTPPDMLRVAVRRWPSGIPYPWFLHPQITWRWLHPLLADPLPRDESSTKARLELASHALVHDPRDVAARLPRAELVTAATNVVRRGLFLAAGSLGAGRLRDLAVSWWADGIVEPLPLMTELPLPLGFALLRAATGVDAAGYDALPEPVQNWLEVTLADPELGIDPGMAATVRSKVSTWRDNLKSLVLWARERSCPADGSVSSCNFSSEPDGDLALDGDLGEDEYVWGDGDRGEDGMSSGAPRMLVLYTGISQLVEVDPRTAGGVAILTAPFIELMYGQAAAVVRPADDGQPELTADAVSLLLRAFGGEDSTTGGVVWFGSPAGTKLGPAPAWLVEKLFDADRTRERNRRH